MNQDLELGTKADLRMIDKGDEGPKCEKCGCTAIKLYALSQDPSYSARRYCRMCRKVFLKTHNANTLRIVELVNAEATQ